MTSDSNQKTAESRLVVALVPGKRDIFDKLDVLAAAFAHRDKRINGWEMQFLEGVINRYLRYYTDLSLSGKQIAILDKIHEKVKDVCAI